MDAAVVVVYLLAMIGFGIWGRFKAKDQDDFLVAGRRLGPLLFTGTMAAVVLGGASTVGGVGLGYTYGISGMWLVFSIGLGIITISLAFASRIQRLEIFTVSQMLELRYGPGSRLISGVIMTAYGLMISTTSTVAYAAVFHILFGVDKVWAVLIGGGVVLLYSMLGGMWSITLTDFVQFFIQTIGIFLIMLPVVVSQAGGFSGMRDRLDTEMFNPVGIGISTMFTYFLIYTLGLLIGQDIWQRVFTARSPQVARMGGLSAGVYCLGYAVAGAVIGMAAQIIVPGVESADDVFSEVVNATMTPVVAGFVLAAALAAMMSTASGSLMAASTVCRQDVVEPLLAPPEGEGEQHALVRETGDEVRDSRIYLIGLGVLVLALAMIMPSVVEALTVAYNLLVAGLFVPILGGLLWQRGTITGVLAGMIAGSVTTIAVMAISGIYAEGAIYYGLIVSALAYVIGSLVSRPTKPEVLAAWHARLSR